MWVCPLTASIDWFFPLEPSTLFSYPRYYLTPLEEMISKRFSFLLDNKETLTKAKQSQALKTFFIVLPYFIIYAKVLNSISYIFYTGQSIVVLSIHFQVGQGIVFWPWLGEVPFHRLQNNNDICLNMVFFSFFHPNTYSFNHCSKLHTINIGTNNKDTNFSWRVLVSLIWQKQLACLCSSQPSSIHCLTEYCWIPF